jgi:hypothetical protein
MTGAVHALLFGIVGVAILCDHVVGVARTPANIAVAIGMIASSGLLVPDALGLLPKPWTRAAWAMAILLTIGFVVLNIC